MARKLGWPPGVKGKLTAGWLKYNPKLTADKSSQLSGCPPSSDSDLQGPTIWDWKPKTSFSFPLLQCRRLQSFITRLLSPTLPVSSLLEKETAKVNPLEHLLCPCSCPCPSYYTANRYVARAYTLELKFPEPLFQLHREAGLPYQAEFSPLKKQSMTKASESVCLG